MDGLDVGLWRISGVGFETEFELRHFETVEIPASIKNLIQKVFHKASVDVRDMMLADRVFGEFCGESINFLLKKWNVKSDEIDLIASHGQTIYHHPNGVWENVAKPTTLQIGDGDFIAQKTGIRTVSDFRQRHVAAGGEGAPLSAYADAILFSKRFPDAVFLNLGGIANGTFFQKSRGNLKVISSDFGPANGLLDAWIKLHFPNLEYDKDGQIAAKGAVDFTKLFHLLQHPFFGKPFPKSTGREEFSLGWLVQKLVGAKVPDVARTLCRFSAKCVELALTHYNRTSSNVYVSGGGWKNPVMRAELGKALPKCSFQSLDDIGIPSDAKESLIFSILGNESQFGDPYIFKKVGLLPVRMGKVSLG